MENKIREAYENMTPTPEQEERMLAVLQEAQLKMQAQPVGAKGDAATAREAAAPSERLAADASSAAVVAFALGEDAVGASGETAGAADGGPSSAASDAASFEAKPAPERKRGGVRAWKIVAPIAACLVVGAVVIGVGALGQSGGSTAATTLAASEAASVQAAPQASNGAEADSRKSERKEPPMREGGEAGRANASSPEGARAESPEREGMAADSAYEGGALGMMATSDDVSIPEGGFNTEEYAAIDENGFVSTKAQPLSTVSADVDTASYANLRRMINDGYSLDQVPAGAVRVEEMLNYFTYNYDRPSGSELFNVQAQAAPCPWNPDTQLLTIGFATPAETEAAAKGANLVFLIDVSGSMDSPDKLELLQDSFATLLENLDENDRVSVVTYSGAEEVVLEGASGSDDGQILRAIYKLRASGSTNGEAGLRMAYEVAQRNFIEGGVNRIVMASDGDLNVGLTSESDLYSLVESMRDSRVYLSVLGFGSGNYKDTKMEVLADHGNGSYHYIDSIEEANRVLSERLMANLVPFADDVKVQVEFNPAQVKGYRLIGYENRELAAEDFLDDSVDAGDVGPNSQFTVAYEVVLANSAYEVNVPELKYGQNANDKGEAASEYADSSNSSDWLTCSLRYHALSDNATHAQDLVVSGKDSTDRPSDDWKFAASVIEFGMMASGSDYRGGITCDSVLDLLGSQELNRERESFRSLVEKAKRLEDSAPRTQ